jgi:CheY-like chemotaxis protein/signal transduction histidine kinase
MNRTFFFILIIIVLFVGVNSVFYITIYNQQLEFQTELLKQQTTLCGNAIEQEGQQFENELNSIPYENDFTRLFTDEEIKQRGSIHLERLYSGYSDLINKITVYDNQSNVYSLILDYKDKFVSDYYESQRQRPLNNRDELQFVDDKYLLTIPGFDPEGNVLSNILVDLDFTGYVNEIFGRYALEQTIWQSLVSPEGELISTAGQHISIPEGDLSRIAESIQEEAGGSFVHNILIDSVGTQVVSVYFPVRLVKRNMGIVFSMKTDLFLKSIITKIILISLCSLVVLILLLYIHFRVVRVRSARTDNLDPGGEMLKNTIDRLPVGLIFVESGGRVKLMNRKAAKILDLKDAGNVLSFSELGLENACVLVDDSIYERSYDQGTLLCVRRESSLIHLFKMEWEDGESGTKLIMLVDVSLFENLRNLEKISHLSRAELLEGMREELTVTLNKIRLSIDEFGKDGSKKSSSLENLHKSLSLLTNLVNAAMDFACRDAVTAVREEIPFSLRSEIDLALEGFRGNTSDISIITKIRNEVPDDLVGDPFRLRQVIINLVENALETTTEGRVLISAEITEQHGGLLMLQFHIEDTGKGISEEMISRIMDDLDRVSEGTGNGHDPYTKRLSASHRHVGLMKGQIWLSSPSSISTNPDLPGVKCSFTMEVFSAKSIKENLLFTGIHGPSEIGCLVLAQEREVDGNRFASLEDLGMKINHLVYRQENMDSLIELVKEKSTVLHMIIVLESSTEPGFRVAEELIRGGITRNLVLILLSLEHRPENYSLSRNIGIEYYLEDPFEPYRFTEILARHFPGLDKGILESIPPPGDIDQALQLLLAEDNVFNRKLIQGLFKRLGCEIDLASNGLEAVEMARNKKYDIIFLDLLMPEMDGFQAVREIRKEGISVPVIALTGVDNDETRKEAIRAGFNDYLLKPASEESLRKSILQNRAKHS